MKISELILMLQQIPDQSASIKVSLQNQQDEIIEIPIGGLLEPADGFKDWSVFGISTDPSISQIDISRKIDGRLLYYNALGIFRYMHDQTDILYKTWNPNN